MGGSAAATARRRNRYAEMLLEDKQYVHAEEQLALVLQDYETLHGPESLPFASAAENLALALKQTGKLGQAKSLLQKSAAIRRQLGRNQLALAATLRQLAEVELAIASGSAAGGGNASRPAEIAQAQLNALDAAGQAMQIAEQVYASATGVQTPTTTADSPATSSGPSLSNRVRSWLSKPTNNPLPIQLHVPTRSSSPGSG